MDLKLKGYCLFCVERIVPFSVVHNNKNSKRSSNADSSPTFRNLCESLGISLSSAASSGSAKPSDFDRNYGTLLCLSCYELAEEFRKAWEQLKELEGKVSASKQKIQDVIKVGSSRLPHETGNGAVLTRKSGRKRKREEKEDIPLSELVERFQSWAAADTGNESETDNCNLKKTSKENKSQTPSAEVEFEEPEVADPDSDADISFDDDQSGFSEELGAGEDEQDNLLSFLPEVEARQEAEDPDFDEEDAIEASKPKRKRSSKNKTKKKRIRKKLGDWPKGVGPINHEKYLIEQKLLAQFPVEYFETKTKDGAETVRKFFRRCSICGTEVRSQKQNLFKFMDHMLSHEEDSADPDGPHKCPGPDCEEEFRFKINFDLHRACLHDNQQLSLRCYECKLRVNFRNREDLIQHLKTEHGADSIHSCKHCPLSYINLEQLLQHIRSIHAYRKKLLCPECDFETESSYSSITELRQHCFDQHPDLKATFHCEFCGKVLLSAVTLSSHKRHAHPELEAVSEQELTCSICNNGHVYSSKVSLQNHISRVHESNEKFKCDYCNKKISGRARLKEHIRVQHENVRHVCDLCGKSYKGLKQFQAHMKIHTGEGLLTCDVCGKQVPTNSQLNQHMRSHRVPDPSEKQTCDICGKEYSDRQRLRYHIRNCHPKEELECEVCGLKFNRKHSLKEHMGTHAGERPYECPICHKGFNRRGGCRVHMKGVHGVNEKLEPVDK